MSLLSSLFNAVFGSGGDSDSSPSYFSDGEGRNNHTPYTSEYSKPHTSKNCPDLHVDNLHFGEGGKHDPRLDVDHITDPGAIAQGQMNYEWHQNQKD